MMSWKTGLGLAFVAAAIFGAYSVSTRLSDEAVTTIVGVACGLAAGVPVSLGLLVALVRRRERGIEGVEETTGDPEIIEGGGYPVAAPYYSRAPGYAPLAPSYPQYVVVAPPAPQAPGQGNPYFGQWPGYPPALPPPMEERSFRIVGDEE
jgi:hypothetical protein